MQLNSNGHKTQNPVLIDKLGLYPHWRDCSSADMGFTLNTVYFIISFLLLVGNWRH